MSRGYLIPVGDYTMTTVLINSLRVTQQNPSIAIAVPSGSRVPPDVKSIVDKIVRVPKPADNPWYNADCNVAMMYAVTPYDETIVLSDDMIVSVDIGYMWDLLTPYDLLFATDPRTYRGAIIHEDIGRVGFVQNRLSNIYTAMTYFKKTEVTKAVFSMAVSLADHWQEYRKTRLQGDIGYHPTNDALFACAIKESGYIRESYRTDTDWFSIVDMVLKAQDVLNATEMDPDWVSQINSYVKADGSLVVGQYLQHLPFRYHQADFIKPSIANTLAKAAS